MRFAEPHGDRFDHLLVDFVDAEIAFDDNHAVRFAGGDLAVLLPDAAVKFVLLRARSGLRLFRSSR